MDTFASDYFCWHPFASLNITLNTVIVLKTFAYICILFILFILLPTYSVSVWYQEQYFVWKYQSSQNDSVNFWFIWRGNTLYCFSVSSQLKQINLNCQVLDFFSFQGYMYMFENSKQTKKFNRNCDPYLNQKSSRGLCLLQ